MDALVELRGISKHFGEGETRVDALRDVMLSVGAGEVVGLLGPSDSGKSTLLNVVGCIVEPNEGWMRLDGEVVYDHQWLRCDLRRLRLEKIGFIFQFHNLLPFLDSTDNVALVLHLAGWPKDDSKGRAIELLEYLQVGHRKHAMPSQLRAARRSAWRLPGRWPIGLGSSSPTSRPPRSIPRGLAS
jgi:putative ABC transport system ATP-binding protein